MGILSNIFNPAVAQIERENRIARNVKESRSISLARYFAAIPGSFYVTGDDYGMDYYRRRAILAALQNHYALRQKPIVIFTTDEQLEAEIIELADSGQLNRNLMVKSANYDNYHFFYNMPIASIVNCINDIAVKKNISNLGLKNYADALAHIVKTEYTVSLPAMLNLMKFPLATIENYAEQKGLHNEATRLRNDANAKSAFDSIMDGIAYSVTPLMGKEDVETGFTLRSGIEDYQVILIRVPHNLNSVLGTCLTYELGLLSGIKTNIIVDNLDFSQNSDLLNMILAISRGNVCGLIADDVNNLMSGRPLIGFGSHIILRCSSPAIMDNYLAQYGTYSHQQIMPESGRGIFGGSAPAPKMQIISRQRIQSSEMGMAVLVGHLNTINMIENTSNLTD